MAIRRELDRLNDAPMACGESRRALFEAHERAGLAALPAHPWEWGEWVERKVEPNCPLQAQGLPAGPRRLGLQPSSAEGWRDLLEIVEQRHGRKSVLIASQIPVEQWPPIPVLLTDWLPSDRHHGWKVLEFGPDRLLYTAVRAQWVPSNLTPLLSTLLVSKTLSTVPFTFEQCSISYRLPAIDIVYLP